MFGSFFYYTKNDTNGLSGPFTVCVGRVFILLNYFWIMFPLSDKRFIDFLTLLSNWTINVRVRFPKMPISEFVFKQTRNGKVCLRKIEAPFFWNPNLTSILRKPNEKWFTEIWNDLFVISFALFCEYLCVNDNENSLLWMNRKVDEFTLIWTQSFFFFIDPKISFRGDEGTGLFVRCNGWL